MLKGQCPKCGASYCGWALNMPRNQMCGYCGTALKIEDDSGETFSGYSPFTAGEYKVQQSHYAPFPEAPPQLNRN